MSGECIAQDNTTDFSSFKTNWQEAFDPNLRRVFLFTNTIYYSLAMLSFVSGFEISLKHHAEFTEPKTLMSALGVSILAIDQLKNLDRDRQPVETRAHYDKTTNNAIGMSFALMGSTLAILKGFRLALPIVHFAAPILYLMGSVRTLAYTQTMIHKQAKKTTLKGLLTNRKKKIQRISTLIESAQNNLIETNKDIDQQIGNIKLAISEEKDKEKIEALLETTKHLLRLKFYNHYIEKLKQRPIDDNRKTKLLNKAKNAKEKQLLSLMDSGYITRSHLERFLHKKKRLQAQAKALAVKDSPLSKYLMEKQRFKLKRLKVNRVINVLSIIAASCFTLTAAHPPLAPLSITIGVVFSALSKMVKVFRPNRNLGTKLFGMRTKVRREYDQMMSEAFDKIARSYPNVLTAQRNKITEIEEKIKELTTFKQAANSFNHRSLLKNRIKEEQKNIQEVYKKTTKIVENMLIRKKMKMPAEKNGELIVDSTDIDENLSKRDRRYILRCIINDRRGKGFQKQISNLDKKLATFKSKGKKTAYYANQMIQAPCRLSLSFKNNLFHGNENPNEFALV